ncbi:MAG: hypothetical protein K6E47_13235, partial [Lachnospiraceae bacterium]|nr:hypothetical protein [Lachnospiraceae bacterium]
NRVFESKKRASQRGLPVLVSLSFLLQQRFLCTIFPVILQGVNCNPPSEILNARIIATVVDVADVADDLCRVIGSVHISII